MTPRETFKQALLLEEGKSLVLYFDELSKARQKSFQVLLYGAKNEFKDSSIRISMKKNRIILQKSSGDRGDFQFEMAEMDNEELAREIEQEQEQERQDCHESEKDVVEDIEWFKASDYKVIGGTRANKIRHAMNTLFKEEFDAVKEQLKTDIDMISLSDLSDEEKKTKKAEISYNANLVFDILNKKRRDAVNEMC
jgi:hypothetical protein